MSLAGPAAQGGRACVAAPVREETVGHEASLPNSLKHGWSDVVASATAPAEGSFRRYAPVAGSGTVDPHSSSL